MPEGLHKLDPALRLILHEYEQLNEASSEFTTPHLTPGEKVHVTVKFQDDPAPLETIGFKITRHSGPFVSGDIPVSRLADLAAHPNVIYIEAPGPDKLKLDTSVPETRANHIRNVNPTTGQWTGLTGSGVIIGIIDTGIDLQHGSFRNADGTTRILFVWDQGLDPDVTAGEPSPRLPGGEESFGVEYDKSWIDQAFRSQDPNNTGPERIVRHKDTHGHGSHVAGIAAGNGSEAERCGDPFEYAGVAPEANLIVVKLRQFGENKANRQGDDINLAAEYIFDKATRLNRPAVINISLGSQIGPHDGTGSKEEGLSNLLAGNPAGQAIVVSAGNEANLKLHAKGEVPKGSTLDLKFKIQSDDEESRSLELWYRPPIGLKAKIVAPDGTASEQTSDTEQHNEKRLPLSDQTTVFLTSDLSLPQNGDNRIKVLIRPQKGDSIPSGPWVLKLENKGSDKVEFDAWLEEESDDRQKQPIFTDPQLVSKATTLTNYACVENLIAVANYYHEGSQSGELSSSSSQGPTRLSSDPDKPDLAAPGTSITAPQGEPPGFMERACCACCRDRYTDKYGTSMSAPHVTGALALMLQDNPNLGADDIRLRLRERARKDSHTEKDHTTPNIQWGSGKLNIQALFDPVPNIAPDLPGSAPSLSGLPQDQSEPQRASNPVSGLRQLQSRLLATKQGRAYARLFDKHFDEIYELINTNKRVATIWHRNLGPSMLSQAMRAASEPDVPTPRMLNGRPVRECLANIANILIRYGSATLAADIESNHDRLWAFEGLSVDEILDQLEKGED